LPGINDNINFLKIKIMKRLLLYMVLSFILTSSVVAQDTLLRSKRGIPILPKAGDWAIGIDARPFTELFNSNSDMGFEFIDDNTLIGKKFIRQDLAHRGKLRIQFRSETNDEYIIEDGQIIPDPTITVKDQQIINDMTITLGYGLEKRSGYGRLQAVYGGEFLFSINNYNESYEYGNKYSMTNPDPSTTQFGNNTPESGKRVTYIENGVSLGAMLRPFLGVEYFIAPKMSIGGEFGYGIRYSKSPDGKTEVESWDPANNNTKYEIYKSGGSSGFEFDNDNFGGAIFLMFYFK
jgi:hypothetical protein